MIEQFKKHYQYILLVPLVFFLITKFGYAHNITDSLPHKHFIIVKHKNVAVGDYILFAAPKSSKYVGMNLIKQIVGDAGCKVVVNGNQVFINQELIGVAKSHAKTENALAIASAGIISDGKYFVANKHVDSYDSRYLDFGLIDGQDIIGVAHPLW